MKTAAGGTKKKRSIKKIILWIVAVFLIILTGAAVYLYYNLNKVITSSLNKSFNSSIISDVYELKFERLSVNFLTGNISVHNVSLLPREKPLHSYPYINTYAYNTGALVVEIVDLKNVTPDGKVKVIWNAYMGDLYSALDYTQQSLEAIDQAFVQSNYLVNEK